MRALQGLLHKLRRTDSRLPNILVRVSVGAIFLSEGIQKFLLPNELGAGRFTTIGLPWPDVLAALVATCEITCGTLVLLGAFVRIAVLPLIVVMCVALISTKLPILLHNGFWKMAHEARTDFAMLLSLLFLLLSGAGRWSVDATRTEVRQVQ